MIASNTVIYVVDDDLAVRRALRRLIKSVGLAVETFPSAKAFLEYDRPAAPGCLILDIRMPGMNGLELQEHLTASGAEIPIIFKDREVGDSKMSKTIIIEALVVVLKLRLDELRGRGPIVRAQLPAADEAAADDD